MSTKSDISYFQQYYQKIIDKKQITWNVIQPGMIIELHYNKKLADGQKKLKRYIVLVLSTKQVPDHKGRYIYGLSLENVLPINFNRLVEKMGLDEMSVKLYKTKKVIYPRVLIPEEVHPKNIYNTYIKPRLNTTLKDSYRQFKKENILKIYAVNFEWSEHLIKKYLIEDKPNVTGHRASEEDKLIT